MNAEIKCRLVWGHPQFQPVGGNHTREIAFHDLRRRWRRIEYLIPGDVADESVRRDMVDRIIYPCGTRIGGWEVRSMCSEPIGISWTIPLRVWSAAEVILDRRRRRILDVSRLRRRRGA